MNLFEIIVSLSLIIMAVSSIVFPTIYLSKMSHYHKQDHKKNQSNEKM
ncbi:MAG: hypothetical protein RSF69_01325 [Erysipelotrichaceae bacterium]